MRLGHGRTAIGCPSILAAYAPAEDLVQTALVRTALRWSRVEDPAKAMAYVKTTMVRHVTETPSVRFDVVQGRITTSR
jgi:hypothetical protein